MPETQAKKKLSERLTTSDHHGNRIEFIHGKIYLHLINKYQAIPIGEMRTKADGNQIYLKHVKESNIFRRTNSWGLNNKVIQELADDNIIVLRSKKHTYTMTVKKAKANAIFLDFFMQGFEKQLFVPLDCWDRK